MHLIADIWIAPLAAIVAVLMGLVGIEMANNPPEGDRAKWSYRIIFVLLAACSIWITLEQSRRSESQKSADAKTLQQQQVRTESQLGYMTGKLETLATVYGDLAKQKNDSVSSSLAKTLENFAKQPPPQSTPTETKMSITGTMDTIPSQQPNAKYAQRQTWITNKQMNGAHAIITCNAPIISANALISGSNMMMGGSHADGNQVFIDIDAPSWAPNKPLIVTIHYDDAGLDKCQITPR